MRVLFGPLFFLVGGLAPPAGAQLDLLRQPDAVYAPTPQNMVEAMLEMAQVTPADIVYDLGSGDGRIPITAASKYGARGVGIDIDARRIREANDNTKRAGVGNLVRFVHEDLFRANISEATVVTLYLGTRLNQQLMPKLKAELRPGTRIVSHQFHMGDAWPAERSLDIFGLMIYLWTIR
jgi:cyclopropane fatty-acyl-phospholipid synthase-like methyltransferase